MKQQAKFSFKNMALSLPFKISVLTLIVIMVLVAVWCGLVINSIPLDKLSPVSNSPTTKKKPAKRKTKQEILLARDKEKKAALKKAVQKQKDFINHKLGGI